jgi:hypothetical protein
MCHTFKRDVWFYYLTHISFISVQKICKSTFKSTKTTPGFHELNNKFKKIDKKKKKKG